MIKRLDQHELVPVGDIALIELVDARSGLEVDVLSPGAYRLQIFLFGGARPARRLAEVAGRAEATIQTYADANATFILHTTERSLYNALVEDLRE